MSNNSKNAGSLFRNPAAEFVYVRTYSRWIEELDRRETWPETVDRYISFITKHLGNKIPEKVIRKIKEGVLSFSVMPSMRFLWAAGSAAEQDNTTIYNCSFAAIDKIDAFAEALYILMCGTGFGFSVENKYVSQLPKIPIQILPSGQSHEVGDSKVGWADSIKILMNSLYSGYDIEMKYNNVRHAGARLKTMGGRASGPGPLAQLHYFIKQTFYNARGRQLTDIECHDILCEIAQIVVVGGVRRSSEISLSDLDSKEMRKAKLGAFPVRRYMSNNSAVYYIKPDIVSFMEEWTNLIASKSGERGISNLAAARNITPKRRDASKIQGTNPCVPGHVEILTDYGYQRIDSLNGKETKVWNGFEWSTVTPLMTGRYRKVVNVSLSSGQSLICTDNHKFVISLDYHGNTERINAADLKPGMKLIKANYPILDSGHMLPYAYTQGFISADGMDDYNFFDVYDTKYMCLHRMNVHQIGKDQPNKKRVVPYFAKHPKLYVPFDWCLKSKLDWFAGLLDGDGTVLVEGGIQIGSVNETFLLQVQKLLTTMGTPSKVCRGVGEGFRDMPDGKGGEKEYWCKQAYRLMVGSKEVQDLVKLGLHCERLKLEGFDPNRSAARFVTVTDVEDAGVADQVFCFNEPLRHLGCFEGVVTGQCHEIGLRSEEFCNLSEVVTRIDDDIDGILQKIETATWMGVIQACFTNFPYLNKNWTKNCEEERLLGVSITGQQDKPSLFTEEALKAYKAKAIKIATKAAGIMGIAVPAAITCVKPSGTVSQLVDSASGLHPRFSKYYIRRYRISASDPLLKMVRDQGLSASPENGERKKDFLKAAKIYEQGSNKRDSLNKAKEVCPIFNKGDWSESLVNTWVVSFPVASPKSALVVSDTSATEQLEWYKKIQTYWCEHNASITVYVKPDEWLSVGDWVYKNWNIVNGISFLPIQEHIYEQAPYEEITKEKYEELVKVLPKLDYSQLSKYEKEDNTEGAQEPSCASGQCEI